MADVTEVFVTMGKAFSTWHQSTETELYSIISCEWITGRCVNLHINWKGGRTMPKQQTSHHWISPEFHTHTRSFTTILQDSNALDSI